MHNNVKYLEALAETYQNANSWDKRRQVLSIMADLEPYSVIQQFLPGITAWAWFPLPVTNSPRMRVDESQQDHFLSFITSPHVVQDRGNFIS